MLATTKTCVIICLIQIKRRWRNEKEDTKKKVQALSDEDLNDVTGGKILYRTGEYTQHPFSRMHGPHIEVIDDTTGEVIETYIDNNRNRHAAYNLDKIHNKKNSQ